MSTVEAYDFEMKAVTSRVELPRKKPALPRGFAKRALKALPVRSYAHPTGRISAENQCASPVRRNRVRSPSPKRDRLRLRSTSVQKGNSTLAKLRSAKACEKAAKGNGSVAAHAFPSYHNFVSIVPPADRTRANLALCRAPLRGDARKLTA